MKYKVGDWVFHEFRLQQVTEVKNDYNHPFPYELSDGYFIHGATEEDVFPLSLEGKLAADYYRGKYDHLHKIGPTLNWPDLNRKICELFEATMQSFPDKVKTKVSYDTAEQFFRQIEDAIETSKNVVIGGVKLFHRR